MAELVILLALGALAAVYLGYPAAVIALAGLRGPRRALPGPAPRSATIIVCAHNEAAVIADKLRSVLIAAVGRPERIELIVCDDGSTDGTASEVAAVAAGSPLPLRLLRLPRGGKAAALRRAMAEAEGEILIFSDADPLWERDTLGALLAAFRDVGVGAAAGEVRTLRGGWRGGESLFRRYESALRAAEDRLFGCISADGGLFALRAALGEPVPGDVTDDFFLSTAAVARGYRIAFVPQAVVTEAAAPGQKQHFRRRVRITVRGLTGLWRRRALFNPLRTGGYAFGLFFHKLMRRLAPLLLVPVAGAALALALEQGDGPALALLAVLALGALGTALLLLLPLNVPKPLRLPAWLGLHVGGLAVGTLLFLGGRRYSQWAPQERC